MKSSKTRKAKPAPDFTKLHQTWETKLNKGKAVSKKPLTQVQPFELSNPATLTYKLKQKLDFGKAGQDTLFDENFEQSPDQKEKILSGNTTSEQKKKSRLESSTAVTLGDTPAMNTRSKSLYVSSVNNSSVRGSFYVKNKFPAPHAVSGGKENNASGHGRQSGKQKQAKAPERGGLVKSGTGFEKIEVVFKPDPEALKSIFIEPDSSPYKQCQLPFQRSTFGGKMKSTFGKPAGGSRLSIYARRDTKANDISYKEYLQQLRRESLAARERRSSIHQSMVHSTFAVPLSTQRLNTSTKPGAWIPGSTVVPANNTKTLELSTPSLPVPKLNTLVGFQGGMPNIKPDNIRRGINVMPPVSKQPFPSVSRVGNPTTLGAIDERLSSQRFQLSSAHPPSRNLYGTAKPATVKSGISQSVPKQLATSPAVPSKTPFQHNSMKLDSLLKVSNSKGDTVLTGNASSKEILELEEPKSVLKDPASVSRSRSKRTVQWSDVLRSEQSRGDALCTDGTSIESSHARKALSFSSSAPSDTDTSDNALSTALPSTPKASVPFPDAQPPLIDIRTPITAEEIRRRGIDPFSFDKRSPCLARGLLTEPNTETSSAAKNSRSVALADKHQMKAEGQLQGNDTSPPRTIDLQSNNSSIELTEKLPPAKIMSPDKVISAVKADDSRSSTSDVKTSIMGAYPSSDLKTDQAVNSISSIFTEEPSKPSIFSLGVGAYFSEEFLRELYGLSKKNKDDTSEPKSTAPQKVHSSVCATSSCGSGVDAAVNVMEAGISSLSVMDERGTPEKESSPVPYDKSFITPEKSFNSFLTLADAQCGPNPIRRKARTPHSKGSSNSDRHIDPRTPVPATQVYESNLLKSETIKPQEPKVSGPVTSNSDVQPKIINSTIFEVTTANAQLNTNVRYLKEEGPITGVPPQQVSMGSAVWTRVDYRSKSDENQEAVGKHLLNDQRSPFSRMVDHEVSLISQKIDVRRKAQAFTPIRETFSNPLLRDMHNEFV